MKRSTPIRNIPTAAWAVVLVLALLVPVAQAADAPATAVETQKTAPVAGPDTLRFKGGLPEVLPIPGDPRPYGDSAYAAQIDRALAYLAFKDRGPNRLFRMVLLDYLQRRFQLHERYSLHATTAPHLSGTEAEDLANFKRLTDPNFVVDASIIDGAEPMERLALRALYCDAHPQDPAFLDEIITEVNNGVQVFLPSLAMAYLWMRDNGCLVAEPKFFLFRDSLAVKFRNNLQQGGLFASMAPQSLAMLFALDHPEMVEELWMVKFAEAQNDDGGWPGKLIEGQKGMSDGMATVHVLWALLEHALPNNPRTPMLLPKAPAAAAE